MAGRPEQTPILSPVESLRASPTGGFVELDGEAYYKIAAYHRLAPFLMSLPSDSDLWMFVASSGGLTAGRVDAEGSLFPYRTADQLYDDHHRTGPLTLIRVTGGAQGRVLWEPFSETNDEDHEIERNLYKNVVGNRLVFEEIHNGLGLAFRHRWAGCDEFGWIRTATVLNRSGERRWIDVLDGFRNVLPFGAPLSLYQQASNLVDAYKTSEVDPETGLGVFALTAGITDRAEALEVLRANTVWCHGPANVRVHLKLDAVAAFRHGRVLSVDDSLHGARGNYLVSSSFDLGPDETESWHIIGDVGRNHLQIADLRRRIRDDDSLGASITRSLSQARENLRRNVGSADGIEMSGRPESWSHHFANVLFNNMRGGVFDRNHSIPIADFRRFLMTRNTAITVRMNELLTGLPDEIDVHDLHSLGHDSGDQDFARLCLEYLPLHFGRRHGDPSRPWNRFAIRVRNEEGERELRYEGNWRDIFQNWEALSTAFPGFLPGMVATFIDASTIDGFNPYRITREGVDWETISPHDPWGNIGYWGDHQIVYLLRLLELLDRHDPDTVGSMLGEEIFCYADVPYRIKPYKDILSNPRETIDFDEARAARIDERVAALGSDGKLLTDADGSVRHVNLLEKLLVPLLSKLSNLIPDAGIWMNTQRPEWNDANNVLAGGGVSVVTLCHLRRYLNWLVRLLADEQNSELPVASEIVDWFNSIAGVLEDESNLLSAPLLAAGDRKRVMDRLGEAFSDYRDRVYMDGLSGTTPMPLRRVADLCTRALTFVDWGIAANRREDGLYHAYNLVDVVDDGVEIIRLQEMLEGQVAVLSSGQPTPDESLIVLDRLFDSAMYRPDQRSFMLYPEQDVPGFLARNRVPADKAEAVPLLRDLLSDEDPSLVACDADGHLRFHHDLLGADDLDAAMNRLAERPAWSAAVARDRTAVQNLFEDVFHHKSYTGRSGVMYAYEGQGCIYWHMVAKLLLAVQEIIMDAERTDASADTRKRLVDYYYRVRAGIGYEKTAAEYGAFPTDPYSHTPPGGGAKQPGTTGQVKEEILTRRGELGIRIENGAVSFRPLLLRRDEFLSTPANFDCYDVEGGTRSIPLSANSLAFTLCQVPVIYELVDDEAWIRITHEDGSTTEMMGSTLEQERSSDLFSRSGRIDRIHVGIPKGAVAAAPS